MVEFDVAVRTAVRHGRSPVWDSRTDTVLWVDHPAARAHRYSPGRGTDSAMSAPQPVGAALPRARGGLLLHLDDGLALFEADGETRTWLAYWAREGLHAATTAVDLHGRAWAASTPLDAPAPFRGSLTEQTRSAEQAHPIEQARPAEDGQDARVGRTGERGHAAPAWAGDPSGRGRAAEGGQAAGGDGWLVRVAPSKPVRTELRALPDPRGLAFAPDGTRLYLTDGSTGRVEVIAFDAVGAELGQRQPLAQLGAPASGLCVDAAGCPWVALPDAGVVRRYTPEGVLDCEVELSGHRPTDCCFGGTRLTDLYVTTADGSAGAAPGASSESASSPGASSDSAGSTPNSPDPLSDSPFSDSAGSAPNSPDPLSDSPFSDSAGSAPSSPGASSGGRGVAPGAAGTGEGAAERAALLVVPDAGEGVRTTAFAG